jgi:cellulose synthase/poly-beta-1,6-N-acetylglucosamine synthase-like glycosyltransferase
MKTWFISISPQAKDSLHLYPPLLGSNCAYRLTALDAVGGFRPGATLEDSDLTVRLAGLAGKPVTCLKRLARQPPRIHGPVMWPNTAAGRGVFGEVVSSEFGVSSSGFQVSGFRSQVAGLLARLELFLFATGYLDRLALAVVMLGWLSQHRRPPYAPRTTHHVISLTLLTPLIQIITALWLEKSAAAYWFRLIILPFFFLLDILTACLGMGQSLLGIIWGRRGRD